MIFKNKKVIYLAGSMSGMKTFGAQWRKMLRKWLAKYDLQCFDPCVDEVEFHQKYDLSKIKPHQWDKFPIPLQVEIMLNDLNQIKYRTSFIICYFTKYSTGTVSELTFAGYHDIPCYIVTSRKLSGWPLTVSKMKGNMVFKNFDELKRYISRHKVNK